MRSALLSAFNFLLECFVNGTIYDLILNKRGIYKLKNHER